MNDLARAPADFTLVLGGPLFQRLRRLTVANADDLRVRRMVAIPLLAWVPLLILTLVGGTCRGGVALPFVGDFDAHTRLLGALPLLLGSEILVHRRLRAVMTRFVEDSVVGPNERAAFDAIVASTMRWRNSITVEIVLLLLSFTVGHQVWQTQLRLDTTAWYGSTVAGRADLTLAGSWYAFVSLPILRFLLFRWYFRLGLWYRLLFRVSRLPLQLCSLHPDRAGGLGFVAGGIHAFTPFALAHSLPMAGMIATRILHGGATLPQFRVEIGVVLGVLLAVVLLPILLFRGPLLAAKARAARQVGAVVRDLARAIRPGGSGQDDPGSATGVAYARLADLDRMATANERMRTVLFTRVDLVRTAVVVASPLAPLLLTMFPVEEILRRAIDVVF